MLKKLLLVAAVVLAIVLWFSLGGKEAPEVRFAPAERQTLVSTLTTNGKVEPIEWASIRTQFAGPVSTIRAKQSQSVSKGELLLTIAATEAEAELASARSRVAQARAELETLAGGGRAADVAEIESGLAQTKAQLAAAERDLETTRRLVERKAATQAELLAAEQAVQNARLEMESLTLRREALVSKPDQKAAEARLEGAQSAVEAALERVAAAEVRSPMAGVLYDFDVQPGAFLTTGQEIGRVGRLSELRVIVYVDEPELGRVKQGMPVTITWDALPEREWTGSVESVPLQVVSLGSRQVGEVLCTINNPDLSLIPGTNVNAEVQSQVVDNALTIPKEALRREGDQVGVYKLEGDRVVWQPVVLGAASVTHVQAVSGLNEGDQVAVSSNTALSSGDPVRVASR